MSHLENDPGNSNDNLSNNTTEKKPNALLEALLGIGAVAFFYVATIVVFNINSIIPSVKELILFLILGLFVFTSVKLFRTNHKTAGILVIVLTAPLILFMMLAGACVLMLGGF